MSAPLTSDELGEKGEKHFGEICADAKLICNKSERDRTGWDFIVEFPLDSDVGALPLDRRGVPLSCHVQMKTMWESSKRFRMRLSAAERLAKDLKPAFVYVFKLNEKLDYIDSYLVHLIDENLAAVLKRLRSEQRDGRLAINNNYLTFDAVSCGVRMDPTGAALRSGLQSMIGKDMRVYCERKSHQLKTLGYERGRLSANVSFEFEKKDDILDFLLGRKPAKVRRFDAHETRFGISLPTNELAAPGNNIFEIKPVPTHRCKITLKQSPLKAPVVFEGDVYLPVARFIPNRMKFVLDTKFFEFLIEDTEIKFSTKAQVFAEGEFRAEEWVEFFRMLSMFAEGESVLEIAITDGPTVSFSKHTQLNGGDSEQIRLSLELCKQLNRVLTMAGDANAKVKFQDAWEAGDEIEFVATLFSDPDEIGPNHFPASFEPSNLREEILLLYVSYLTVGSASYGYSAIVTTTPERCGDGVVLKSSKISPLSIKRVVKFPNDFASYVHECTKNSDAMAIFVRSTTTEASRATLIKETHSESSG